MNTPDSQRGVALLIATIVLLTGSALFLVNEYHAGRQDSRLQSMLSAKQALIAFAVNYADNYGHNTRGGTGRLPCPSLERHGSPARSCSENAIGYLPSVWLRDNRLMEIDYLERFFDQNIWYAVSADHRYNPAFNSLNSYPDTGLLSVDSMQEVVAVLISPGLALEDQSRANASNRLPSAVIREYLEGDNADMDSEFTLSSENDLVVLIRRQELLPLMERRVLGFVKQWLIEYKSEHGFYPYAAIPGSDGQCVPGLSSGFIATESALCDDEVLLDIEFSNLPDGRSLRNTWFGRYEWAGLVYYVVDETCTAERGRVDCDGVDDPPRELQVNGEPAEVVLISVGEPIETIPAAGMQSRIDSDLAQYLDTDELLSAVNEFFIPRSSALSNDQLVTIN